MVQLADVAVRIVLHPTIQWEAASAFAGLSSGRQNYRCPCWMGNARRGIFIESESPIARLANRACSGAHCTQWGRAVCTWSVTSSSSSSSDDSLAGSWSLSPSSFKVSTCRGLCPSSASVPERVPEGLDEEAMHVASHHKICLQVALMQRGSLAGSFIGRFRRPRTHE